MTEADKAHTGKADANVAARANRLARTTSPYLLQHAGNPVDWWPWCDEAFAHARAEGKPVLLSIGYAACHWCHVMAHESFENEAIAALMNELFVNIKVDREERPDVDHVYMSALQALGEHGGWPLTMFLNADREAFWGGTYFPPASRYGKPGFPQVLREVARIHQQEPERIRHNAAAIGNAIASRGFVASQESVTARDFDLLADRVAQMIDPLHGGLRGAPKFPNTGLLELLWRAADRSGNESERGKLLRGRVLLTLSRMAEGGIHDHLGGGFARYSVDDRWLVPHFEKMLYDNAQLLELYALAFAETGDPLFRHTAEGIVTWLTREMVLPGGGFASSLDADSEGEEGRFYVWSAGEIEKLLDPDDAALVARFYDVQPQGNWEGHNILNRLDMPEPDEAQATRLAALRDRLLQARAGRVRPGQDDKVLADWNGLMIAALARSALLLGHPEWLDPARAAYRFITESMMANGHLAHAWRGHVSVPDGFALDHAAMARAALALFEQTGEPAFRDDALRLTDILIRRFRDPADGVLAMIPVGRSDLPVGVRPTHDDAVPNANGVFLENLVRLLPQAERFRARIDDMLAALAPLLEQHGLAHASLWNAIELYLRAPTIVVAGPRREELREVVRTIPFPNRIFVDLGESDSLAPDSPAAAQLAGAGDAAAFICRDNSCSLPIKDPAALREALLPAARSQIP